MKVEYRNIGDGNVFATVNINGWAVCGDDRPTKKEAKDSLKQAITKAYIKVCIPKKVRKMINKGVGNGCWK